MAIQKSVFIILFHSVFIINFTNAFEISESSISPSNPAKVGSEVTLHCKSDGRYEYCDWWSGDLNSQNKKYCKFEWKRNVDDVRQQECNIADKTHFDGVYDSNECKLVLKNVETSDSGIWTCRMEEYSRFGRGTSKDKKLKLEVGSSINIRQGTNKYQNFTSNSTNAKIVNSSEIT